MKTKCIISLVTVSLLLTLTGLGQAKGLKNLLTLRLSGAYGISDGGDFNTFFGELKETLTVLDRLGIMSQEGTLEKIKWGYEFEGEIIWNVHKNVGIGVGAGYITRGKESSLDILSYFDYLFPQTVSIIFNPKFNVYPIKLSAHLHFPIGPRWNFFFNGGVGYYLGRFNYDITAEVPREFIDSGYTGMDLVDCQSKFKDNVVGFHGGVGFEFNVSRNIWYFMEGTARYVKFKNLEGDVEILDSEQLLSESASGPLWFSRYPLGLYPSDDLGGSVPFLTVSDTEPYGELLDKRKAIFDLSGVAIRVGILIKF